MTELLLRRIVWDDGTPSSFPDYGAYAHDQPVGRIYFTVGSAGREFWFWTLYTGITSERPLPQGLVDSQEEAMAALKAAWLRRPGADVWPLNHNPKIGAAISA